MTKSFISIFIFFSIYSSAELLLEITQGSDNPINLGIYEISNQDKEHSLIKNIIQMQFSAFKTDLISPDVSIFEFFHLVFFP